MHVSAPTDELTSRAWQNYAELAQVAMASWNKPEVSMAARRKMHERAIDAYDKFMRAFRGVRVNGNTGEAAGSLMIVGAPAPTESRLTELHPPKAF